MVFLELRRHSRVTTGISAFPLGWPWEAQSSPRVARESCGISRGNPLSLDLVQPPYPILYPFLCFSRPENATCKTELCRDIGTPVCPQGPGTSGQVSWSGVGPPQAQPAARPLRGQLPRTLFSAGVRLPDAPVFRTEPGLLQPGPCSLQVISCAPRLHCQGPASGCPHLHARMALPPTERKRLSEKAAEQGCRPVAHRARVKGGSSRSPAFSRVLL